MKKINVDHILVQSKHEAEDILKLLNGGKDFAEMAKKYSTCSSAPNGGALGEVSVQRLDEDFSDAALMLKPGQVSTAPVRTKFGYHLIRRNS
jgi:peptidylprolyl isomerase/peptidyl-prolyl cis-trans isomerase C